MERDTIPPAATGGGGIDVRFGTGWIVRNSVFRDITSPSGTASPATALFFHEGSSGTTADRNVFVRCDRSVALGDFEAADGHAGGLLRGNIVSGGAADVPAFELAFAESALVLNNTIFFGATSPGTSIEISGSSGGGNTVENNLLGGVIVFDRGADGAANSTVTNMENVSAGAFLDPAVDDLHLAAGSAAIDAGTPHPDRLRDIDCDAISPGAPDIGADEYRLPTAVATASPEGGVPGALHIEGNKPNPFNPETVIAFDLGVASSVTLNVYDAGGRLVRVLIDRRPLAEGRHTVTWNGRSEEGKSAASGVYFYTIDAGGERKGGRMVMIR